MASAGWRLPVRSGTLVSPSMTAPSAEASEVAAASCIATSTRWPLPVRSRCTSAPRMPAQRWMPARKSHTAAPALVGGPGGVRNAAHRLDGDVHRGKISIGPVEAEARAAAVHEPRVELAQHVVAQAEAIHHAGGEVLDQHV